MSGAIGALPLNQTCNRSRVDDERFSTAGMKPLTTRTRGGETVTRKLNLIAIPALLFLLTGQVEAQAPRDVVEQIITKVKEYDLGQPRAATPAPQRTPSPRNNGWWQVFERGWVYWSPGNGAHAVRKGIFDRWTSAGREQGRLGFPTSDEINCSRPSKADIYQSFEHARILLPAATNQATIYDNYPDGSNPIGVNGECYPPLAAIPSTTNVQAAQPSVPPLSPQTITAAPSAPLRHARFR